MNIRREIMSSDYVIINCIRVNISYCCKIVTTIRGSMLSYGIIVNFIRVCFLHIDKIVNAIRGHMLPYDIVAAHVLSHGLTIPHDISMEGMRYPLTYK